MAFAEITKVSALNSLRKPAFFITVAVFAALIFLSRFLTIFTLGEPTSMVREVGVSSIFLCGILGAIFLNAASLASEIETGTLAILLTKPISRTRVLLAKFAGNLAALYGALALLTIVFLLTLALDSSAISPLTVQAIILAFLACALASALTLVLASLLPFSPAILVSLCLFALGSLSGYLLSLARGLGALLLHALYAVVPDYGLLNLTNHISSGEALPASAFIWSLLYGLCYTAAALTAASIIFSRREVK